MKGISPFLWFDSESEEAARHYVSIFKNSRMGTISRYGDAGPAPILPGPCPAMASCRFMYDAAQTCTVGGCSNDTNGSRRPPAHLAEIMSQASIQTIMSRAHALQLRQIAVNRSSQLEKHHGQER